MSKFSKALIISHTPLVAQTVKNLPTMWELQEMQVRSLGREDALEKEMPTHSRILAWKIPWTEKTRVFSSLLEDEKSWTQRVGHN